ncbi:MAG: FumA C-terminus/TtdB family hydratase beta subunit [Coriobacteriia bacterium]|nr:FumA C-terminus/TtdB family hydratase beta subunit [Coriobacteriia bacterium]
MPDPYTLTLPITRAKLASLRAGDEVMLSGPVYTARDATHARLVAEIAAHGGVLPYGLDGQTLFYAGPTPPAAMRPAGSVGPTTAKRMDAWTPPLLLAGIVAAIGKGVRSESVREAFASTGSVYFAAVGGSAALLATRVSASTPVAYPDLGTEALVRLDLVDFPVVVAIDSCGNDLYAQAASEWRRALAAFDTAQQNGDPR